MDAKVALCQRDITKVNVDAVVNTANETLISGGNIYGVIHEAAGPVLLHKCQKLNSCETGDCDITLGYKLPAYYVFHTSRPKDCYKSCLQNVLTYDVKTSAFCCVATGIRRFDQRKTAEIALANVRPLLKSNHSSLDHVIFCTNENADYEIFKDLMTTILFLVSNIHLTGNFMNRNSDNGFVVNVKNVETSDEVGQNLSGWQNYPSTKFL